VALEPASWICTTLVVVDVVTWQLTLSWRTSGVMSSMDWVPSSSWITRRGAPVVAETADEQPIASSWWVSLLCHAHSERGVDGMPDGQNRAQPPSFCTRPWPEGSGAKRIRLQL
jgi:hypothetical protein